MTKLSGFVSPNDPILIQIAKEVKDPTSIKTKAIVEQMLVIACGRRKDQTKPTVVGLAAPQIGISQRIIAVDIGADGHGGLSDLRLYINPKIIWKSEEREEWCEGCWSTDKVCGAVSRSLKITIEATTPENKEVQETYSGYVARIFQHEIDHLDGIEFVNHITDNEKLHWVEEDEWIAYKKDEGWRNWPHKCPREKWKRIKGV